MTLLPEVLILSLLSIVGLPVLLLVWLKWRQVWPYLVIVLVGFSMAFVMAFLANMAYGYPENVRMGYPTCAACHVSPAGGGALTAYGRDSSEAFMSTWATKGEGNPGFGLTELPEWLAIGGDSRYINATVKTPDFESHQKFWMQYDLELAVSPVKPVTVAASVGWYGPDHKLEYRRSYVKLDVADAFHLRAGRFLPNYGINFPDHRLPTRAGLGLGEGQESYNIEASAIGNLGEVFITGVYGDDTQMDLQDGSGYAISSDSRSGVVAKGAVFLGDSAQLGISYLGLSAVDHYRQAYGAYTILGFSNSIYFLGEYDRRYEDGTTADLADGRIGWEPYRGIHVSLLGEVSGPAHGGGAQLIWLPRPHWEFEAEFKRILADESYTDSGILMMHYYL